MHLSRPWKFLIVLALFLSAAALAVSQEEAPNQEADGEAAEANGEADQNGDGNAYTGTWSHVVGPSRLLWELETEEYEFYAYQAGTIRIGSRGEVRAEGDELTFFAEEITGDGESWREVELSEENATATYAYSVQEEVLSLAVPGRLQFAVEYQAGEGEPAEEENGEDAEDPNQGENADQAEQAGQAADQADQGEDEPQEGALDIQ